MKDKSICTILEEVKADICDKICKYPEQYTPDEWENVFEDVCANCPLDRL